MLRGRDLEHTVMSYDYAIRTHCRIENLIIVSPTQPYIADILGNETKCCDLRRQ
jgi:hypothetical protein